VNVSCTLDPGSVSPLWCLSAYRSWAAQTSSSSTRALRSTAHTTAMCSCQSSYYPWCARYQGNFSSFNRTTPQHTGTWLCATCSLLLPDLWPANSPDLNAVDYRIWSVVQQRVYQWVVGARHWRTETVCAASVALRRPEHHWQCNWRVAQASSCMRAGERRTLGAYAVKNNTTISSQPYDNINVSFLSNTTRFLIFSIVICNTSELLNFPR